MSYFRIIVTASALMASACVGADEQAASGLGPAAKKTPAEIMPITTANLRGQESLYHEGWFIVSSTEKALYYAKTHSITSSRQAMAQMQADLAQHSREYASDLTETGKTSVQTGINIAKGGTALTGAELALTARLVNSEIDYGSRNLQLAWERFYKGNISLAERTEEDREALSTIPGNWYRHLKGDFSNLQLLTARARESMSAHVEGHWSEAFGEAKASFNESYESSGKRGSSLFALGDILVGYGKSLYAGLLKPASRSTVQGTEAVAKTATKVIFLPVASLFIVTGRTVASTGMALYYTTKAGIKLVSPTVEGGLLAGMSLLSYGAVPVTGAVGGAAGLVNQVAVSAAAPVAGAGQAVVTGAGETIYYAAQVSYDLAKGTTKVTLNQAEAGIALGYNALTAVPTQVLLGAANSVIFLAWDGPRLVLASAKGEVKWHDDKGAEISVPVQSLPVGSVVDLKDLGKEQGASVEIVSDDPKVVEQVLEKLPQDLRVGGQP